MGEREIRNNLTEYRGLVGKATVFAPFVCTVVLKRRKVPNAAIQEKNVY
jgi:hypothetical protein